MSKENITLIYSAIIREKHTILSEYTEFSGNFSQIITKIMKDIIIKIDNIPSICRTYFFYGKYAIFFLKYNKIYIITMFPNLKLNNKEIIFAFLYSIFDVLKTKKEINIEKMGKMKAYTLASFSEVFAEKTKFFYSNCDSFINLLKNLQIFPVFEVNEKNYESEIQLPILSKTQTHEEKKNNEEDEIINAFDDGNRNSLTSFNSVMTYDSFKDDFLNSDNDQININLNEDKNVNLLKENENEFGKNLIKTISTNEVEYLNKVIGNISPNNESKNKCFNCSTRVKIIIIVIIIVIIISIALGIIFSV